MRNKERYPENWTDVIRPAILLRDKYKCIKCGLKHRITYVFPLNANPFQIPVSEKNEWKGYGDKVYTVYLQVAHLDHNESNNHFSNLASMCVKCHLAYDKENNKLRRISKLK